METPKIEKGIPFARPTSKYAWLADMEVGDSVEISRSQYAGALQAARLKHPDRNFAGRSWSETTVRLWRTE